MKTKGIPMKTDGEGARTKGWKVQGRVIALLVVLLAPKPVAAQGRVVTISEVEIVGRVQKPIAAVDVSRISPKLTLAELRQSFSDRIERALYRAPF
jgi:hypothetical protein